MGCPAKTAQSTHSYKPTYDRESWGIAHPLSAIDELTYNPNNPLKPTEPTEAENECIFDIRYRDRGMDALQD